MSLVPWLRLAERRDVAAIAEVDAASRLAAYEESLPPEVLAKATPVLLAKDWASYLEGRRPTEERVHVIGVAEAIVGYSRNGSPRDQDSVLDGATAEIYGFYVHPESWGLGLGRMLMNHVLNDLSERGFQSATLNVVESNERARFFYERVGFSLDKEAAPWFGAPQLRYRKDL